MGGANGRRLPAGSGHLGCGVSIPAITVVALYRDIVDFPDFGLPTPAQGRLCRVTGSLIPLEVQAGIERRPTRRLMVGDVAVGGGAPISVQSMTITRTADHEATLQQVYDLAMAGADIVRCTCNELEAAEGLARIVPRSPVPIVADIHHQYRMALGPPWRPGFTVCVSTPAISDDRSTSEPWRPRPATGACPSGSGSTAARYTPTSTRNTADG
ncbi:MAG: hypothetical protein Ct9H300mP31_13700 [Acidimicrobiaceae bacterium]|nr:MAG: hypothetical protein Ct9H300mP31_13700 [Acidimicrobiaceae bacterium]